METEFDELLEFEAILEESYRDFSKSSKRMSRKGIVSEFDFFDFGSGCCKDDVWKGLPYKDQASFFKVQRIGEALWRCPTVQSAINALLVYVVNRGWEYTISQRKHGKIADQTLNVIRRAHALGIEDISLGTNTDGMMNLQLESYRRLLRSGEFFRRWWIRRDGHVDVRFIEPCDIHQPSGPDAVCMEKVKDRRVLDLFDFDQNHVPGLIGVVSNPDDASDVWGYWYKFSEETRGCFEFISSDELQHAKHGVDSNDPRGVPAFYDVLPQAIRIDEVDEAMAGLVVKQSKFAVTHKHGPMSTRERIKDLARRREKEMEWAARNDQEEQEHHIKGFDVELNSVKVNSKSFVDVIKAEQRFIGGVKNIPEFMITNDANTGNRSSLQSAESPFGRTVLGEQMMLFGLDKSLHVDIIRARTGYSVKKMQNIMENAEVVASFPLTETRDWTKYVETLIGLEEGGHISKQEISRRLDYNFDLMKRERSENGDGEGGENDSQNSKNDPQSGEQQLTK